MNLLAKGRIVTAFALIVLGLSSHARADIMNSVDTVSGSLTVSKRANSNSTVFLNEKSIFETTEYSVYFDRVLSGYPKADRVLMALGTGGTACPALFRIIDLSKQSWLERAKAIFGKQKIVSPEFGTCSDAPEVRNGDGKIAFYFGSPDGVKRWTYIFSDRKLIEESLTEEAYKAIKLAAIAAAVAPALREHGTEVERLDGELPGTIHDHYTDKKVYIENHAGNISQWMKLGDVVALILSNKEVAGVTGVRYALDERIQGIAIEFKKSADKKTVAFLFEEKGEKLYYRLYGTRGDLAAVRSQADNALVASEMWEVMGADGL
ncbi:MAG: hypothetical protein AB7M05_17715 [Alphaproteobacteria bacterium]